LYFFTEENEMFKMVFVVNCSLNMSSGKIASQAAHAAVSLYIKAKDNPNKYLIFFNDIDTWEKLGQKKVVLKGNDEKHLLSLEQQANSANLLAISIRDAGMTQIEPGSLTCLGIFGRKEMVDKVTGKLYLLK
jgi:PTH2 family peptidyl-tRNA hydrolase